MKLWMIAAFAACALVLACLPVAAEAPKALSGWTLSMADSRNGRCKIRLISDRASIESGYLSYLILLEDYKALYILSNENKTYIRRDLQS